jgi:hypothetical protein
MSLRGPQTCGCCGRQWSDSGCIHGPVCGCSQYNFNRNSDDYWCARCDKCARHCKCQEGPQSVEARIAEKLVAAGIKVTDDEPE